MTKPKISIIVAAGKDRSGRYVIGADNGLLWRIKDDLRRFRSLTLGHPIIMGRKTFLSIVTTLGRPLPGRTNIVVTRDPDFAYEGAMVAHSLETAIEAGSAIDEEEIFIGGGGEIYRAALPYADRIYFTEIEDVREGDAFFPDPSPTFTKRTHDERRIDPETGVSYRWIDLERG